VKSGGFSSAAFSGAQKRSTLAESADFSEEFLLLIRPGLTSHRLRAGALLSAQKRSALPWGSGRIVSGQNSEVEIPMLIDDVINFGPRVRFDAMPRGATHQNPPKSTICATLAASKCRPGRELRAGAIGWTGKRIADCGSTSFTAGRLQFDVAHCGPIAEWVKRRICELRVDFDKLSRVQFAVVGR